MAIASALNFGSCRSSNGFSRMYIEPRLGALAFKINDWPERPTVCSTPGMSWANFSMRAIARWVRSTEAESGNCTFSSR